MEDTKNIFSQFNNLTPTEIESLSQKVFELLQTPESVGKLLNIETTTKMVCRKCGSHKVSKYGKDKNDNQRYKCNSCGVFFNATSYSIISNTHKSYDTWRKYIELTLKNRSLSYCAKACDISERTAFIWRHKILNVLKHQHLLERA